MPYRVYRIRKASGKMRKICAPDPALKAKQRLLLLELYQEQRVHRACHGFLPGTDAVQNARVHLGAPFLLCMDLSDFFDSVHSEPMGRYLRRLGLQEPRVAEILDTCFIQPDDHLPQGAPTSPYMANLYCRPLDKKLYTLARHNGLRYSRYADDLTFSGPDRTALDALRPAIEAEISRYGLRVNPDKTTLTGQDGRMEVTGIVVNEGLSAGRRTRDRLRTALHRIEQAHARGTITRQQAETLAGMKFDEMVGLAAHMRHVDPRSAVQHRRLVDLARQIPLPEPTAPQEAPDAGALSEAAPGPADPVDDRSLEARQLSLFEMP